MGLKYFSGWTRKKTHHVFFQEVEEDVDNDEIQEATGQLLFQFWPLLYFIFFWQVEDLAQQVESSNIEVLPNVSENEVNIRKCETPNMLYIDKSSLL